MTSLPDELWDGNGGRLDARKASTRELLVALHVKMDRVIADVADHEQRIRRVEGFTARLLGAAAVLVVVAGFAGALIQAHVL